MIKEILPLFENVQMWDCCEKPIPTPTDWEEIENALEELHYIRGSGVEELWGAIYNADLETQMLDYSSFGNEAHIVNDTDLLMFDDDVACWVNVNCLFDKYRKILKNFS